MPVKADTARLHGWKHEAVEVARQEIFDAVGNLSGITLHGTQVLLGVYLRPSKYSSGSSSLILPDEFVNEDVFQGKVSLILKLGESAVPGDDDPHVETFRRNWGGVVPRVGDWVFHDIHDAIQLSVCGPGSRVSDDRKNEKRTKIGWPARIIFMKDICGRIDDPSIIV